MKNYFLLILILSISLGSCKKPNETDRSLTLGEYQELGMPHYDSVWSYEDYLTAFFVLNTLKYDKPYALPVRVSEKSGALFARIINIDNLSFLQDETLPLHVQADMIKWYGSTLMELMAVYTNIGTKNQYYILELFDIDIFAVRVAQKMLDLGNEINESEDPSDIVMQADFPEIQKMYLNHLVQLFEKQQHTSQYPKQTLELLADSLYSSVSRNMHWFDEDASALIKQAMLTVIDSTSSRNIRNDYIELTEIL